MLTEVNQRCGRMPIYAMADRTHGLDLASLMIVTAAPRAEGQDKLPPGLILHSDAVQDL